jgi:hypothetical protein
MTIRSSRASQDSLQAVRDHLADVVDSPGRSNRALGGGGPQEVEVSAPHAVYSPGVDELAQGRGLSGAEPIATEYLVMDGDMAVATVEQHAGGGGVASTEGPFAEATAQAIRGAEHDPALSDGDYELRSLRVPSLYLMAVWLKDLSGDGDVVIPLAPAPAPLVAGRTYHLTDLEPLLADMSRERLSFDHD